MPEDTGKLPGWDRMAVNTLASAVTTNRQMFWKKWLYGFIVGMKEKDSNSVAVVYEIVWKSDQKSKKSNKSSGTRAHCNRPQNKSFVKWFLLGHSEKKVRLTEKDKYHMISLTCGI